MRSRPGIVIKSDFDSADAVRLSGLTRTMLDYVVRTGLLVPSGAARRRRGVRRSFTFGDVVMLRALARLLGAGVSVLQLRKSLRALRRRHPEITPTSLPGNVLVTDGYSVLLRDGDDVLEDLSNGQLAFAFVLELRRLRDETLAALSEESRAPRQGRAR